MNILITNDDGYQSRGIALLSEIASRYGKTYIIAPKSGQSGKSHAITVCKPLQHSRTEVGVDGVEAYWVDGTPVDCVKLAIHEIVKDNRPTLLLSGINHGLNNSSSVHYSGTLGAAREGAMLGIRSIGFSFDSFIEEEIEQCRNAVEKVLELLVNKEWPATTYLNVNIPKNPTGIMPCRVSEGHWCERPMNVTDPFGGRYTWLEGEFKDDSKNGDGDNKFLKEGYVTISPCQLDVTDYDVLNELKKLDYAL